MDSEQEHPPTEADTPDEQIDEAAPSWRAPLIGLMVLVAVVYLPAMLYGFVTWDDPIYIWFNEVAQHWTQVPWAKRLFTPQLGYPAPLPVAVYAAVLELSPASAPNILHAISVALHLTSTALLATLARRVVPRRVALFAAGLWALHPVCVEGVAWATNLKEALYVTALLGALLAWERWLDVARRRDLVACIGALVVGLLAKPTMAVVPVILAVWGAVRHPERMRERARAALSAVLIAIGVGWFALARQMDDAMLGDNPGSAAGFEARTQWVAMTKALGLQVMHWVWPADLHPYYPEQLHTPDALTLLGAVAAVAVLAGLLFCWRRRDTTLAAPLLAMAALWIPYSNIVGLPRFTSDTYAYGVATMVALVSAILLHRAIARVPEALKRYAPILGVITWLGLAGVTLDQVGRWSSTEVLWGPLLGTPEQLSLPYSLIGYELHVEGRHKESAELIIDVWPHILAQTGPPGFAPEMFLKADKPEWAARAKLQQIARLPEPPPAHLLAALDFLVTHDLPVPDDSELRAVVRRAVQTQRGTEGLNPATQAWVDKHWVGRGDE